jgi:hypothetical protein
MADEDGDGTWTATVVRLPPNIDISRHAVAHLEDGTTPKSGSATLRHECPPGCMSPIPIRHQAGVYS